MQLNHVELHGKRIGYRAGGDGPAVVLIHGMAGSSQTWEPVLDALSRDVTVIAPDLLGHGSSDKPRTDYSLGALASCVRDVMLALGHERATIAGHSLGGGVALQFAYQFPERAERLVLVSSGGLGREVSPLLRALSAPGAEYALALGCRPGVLDAGVKVLHLLRKVGLRPARGADEVRRSFESLFDPDTRRAFLHTLRAVVDTGGQRVSATDRLYLAASMPALLVWGDRDPFIPVSHGRAAHDAMPGSRLEIFDGAGHYPHCEDPARFTSLLAEFVRSAPPARLTADGTAAALRAGSRPDVLP